MANKIVKAELNVISSTKGGSIAPHYDSGTKSLYLEQFNYEDAVVLQNSMYNKIYGEPKYISGKILPIVKISYKNKSIYRRIELNSTKGFVAGILALTPKFIRELANIVVDGSNVTSDRPQKGDELDITPGCVFMYYWRHPNSATRMSFRLGLPSLLLSIVSLVVGVYSVFRL
jgi:hypothetical protein